MFTNLLLTTLVHSVFFCLGKTENIQHLSFTADSNLDDLVCPASSMPAGEDRIVNCAYICISDHTCDGFSFSRSNVCALCTASVYAPSRSFQSLSGANTYLLPCSRDWELYGGACYFIVTTKMNQATAHTYCQNQVIGGHLVYIETQEENAFIANMMLEKYPSAQSSIPVGIASERQFQRCVTIQAAKIWMGSDDSNTNIYRWFDGTPIGNGFTDWYGNEPSNVAGENCLAASTIQGYQWTDDLCNRQYWSVCEATSQWL